MQLNALFCCLRRYAEASCHKHFVVFCRNQHRRLLPAMCNNLRDGGRGPLATVLTTPARCSVNSRQIRFRIAIYAYPMHLHSTPPLVGSHWNIAMPFGTEKLEWCGYQVVKKIDDMFIRFDRIHERDGHTDIA